MSEPLIVDGSRGGTTQRALSIASGHCCACEAASALLGTAQQKAELEHNDFVDILSAAGQLLTAEYRNVGDRPKEACDAAEKLLARVFRVADVALGSRGIVMPDSWTLGGKSRG